MKHTHQQVPEIVRIGVDDWLCQGPTLVARGAAGVFLTDRYPFRCRDALGSGFGWQFQLGWGGGAAGLLSWNVPAEIFEHLPPCPQARGGAMPRWETREEAIAALNAAAWRWAQQQVETQRTSSDSKAGRMSSAWA